MKDRMMQVARRLLAAIKRRRRLLLICAAGVFALFAGAAYLGSRYPERKGFGSFRELHEFAERHQSADLSGGTWYRGDKDGFSYFYHIPGLTPNLELEVPADAWKHSRRFPYTYDRKQWVGWMKIEEEGGLGGLGAMRAWEAKTRKSREGSPGPAE
jgi:hypothetical protein